VILTGILEKGYVCSERSWARKTWSRLGSAQVHSPWLFV